MIMILLLLIVIIIVIIIIIIIMMIRCSDVFFLVIDDLPRSLTRALIDRLVHIPAEELAADEAKRMFR